MRQCSGRASGTRGFFVGLIALLTGACGGADGTQARDPGATNASDQAADSTAMPIERATATVGGSGDPIAESPPKPRVPGITAHTGYERILQKPDVKAPLIGLIRAGQTVPLANPERLSGPGIGHCDGGFYAVKPRGYVCTGRLSSLDPDDHRALAAAEVLPNTKKSMPYRVGTLVSESPQYTRIPTAAEQRQKENKLDDYLKALPSKASELGVELSRASRGPSPRIVRYIEAEKPKLTALESAFLGRKMAFISEFDAEGRTFLVTPDLTFVPKDKVKFANVPQLKGVDLTAGEMKFPIGFTWIGDSPKLKKTHDGKFIETGEVWPRQTFIQIDGQLVMGKGGPYWKTSDGTYVRNDQLTIFKAREGRPVGVGKTDKWVDVRVTWGTLVAYEGDTPVFITAISPGQDGVTERAHGHTTKRGTFNVGWKLISADMNGVDKAEPWAVDEVPFVAYYKDSYALHGAWWHDDFGRPKSHGCVNLAPNDAHKLWGWLDPELPEGWYAAAAYYPEIKGTTVRVRP